MATDVLLVNPSAKIAYGEMDPPVYPPLGLGYIAAVIEKGGFKVKIVDMDIEGLDLEGLEKIFTAETPRLVGITCSTPLYSNAVGIAKKAKKHNALVAMGGIHPTIKPEETIGNSTVDFLVMGEGEKTFLELTDAILSKDPEKRLPNILGIVFKKQGKAVYNKPRPLVENLDELPFPARHLFRQQKYTYPAAQYSPTIPIMTSRGCPGQCTYCCTKNLFGLRHRTRSIGNIIAEIEHVIKEYGAREIHIWDDNFVVNKKQLLEFCREIKERGIDKKVVFAIPQGLRVDQVDEESLRALKSINVYSVGFGVESGSQKILDLGKKGITLEQSRKAIEFAKKAGLEVWAFFIFGLYGDTEETMRQTIDFAKELDPDFAKFLILKPFPGTEVFEQLDRDNLIIEKDYDKYGLYERPIHRLPETPPEKILEMQNTAFKEFYLRPRKVLKQILRIRSFYGLKIFWGTAWSILRLNILAGKK